MCGSILNWRSNILFEMHCNLAGFGELWHIPINRNGATIAKEYIEKLLIKQQTCAQVKTISHRYGCVDAAFCNLEQTIIHSVVAKFCSNRSVACKFVQFKTLFSFPLSSNVVTIYSFKLHTSWALLIWYLFWCATIVNMNI